MLHVFINDNRYNLADESAPDVATAPRIREAQKALQAAGALDTPILDRDDEGEEFDTGDTLPDEIPEKAFVLADVLGCSPLDCLYDGYGLNERWTSNTEPGEFAVYEESEREEAISEYLDSLLDERLREAPEDLVDYINRDAWKEDRREEIEAGEGYGGPLASYDGHERDVCIDGTWYYVYRVG